MVELSCLTRFIFYPVNLNICRKIAMTFADPRLGNASASAILACRLTTAPSSIFKQMASAPWGSSVERSIRWARCDGGGICGVMSQLTGTNSRDRSASRIALLFLLFCFFCASRYLGRRGKKEREGVEIPSRAVFSGLDWGNGRGRPGRKNAGGSGVSVRLEYPEFPLPSAVARTRRFGASFS